MARPGNATPWLLALILAGFLVTLPTAAGPATDQFGRSHALEDAGTTVVDFAASWCEPCYDALPLLQELAASHPEIRFLVVSVDEDSAGRDQMVEEMALRLPVIWDDGHEIVERFLPSGFPATYVLNSAGDVIYQHVGFDRKKWRRLVAALEGVAGTTRAVSGRSRSSEGPADADIR